MTAISVRESVNCSSSGGRYADVVVSEYASPNAPRPSTQERPRLRRGSETTFAGRVDISCNFYRFSQSCRHLPGFSSST